MTAVGLAMPYQVVTALFGTVGNIQAGHVDFELLPALCLFETAGFGLGVALARRTPTATLRTLIGGVCCLLGLVLLVRGRLLAGLLIFALLAAGLAALDGRFLLLLIPLLIYVGAALLRMPEEIAVRAYRDVHPLAAQEGERITVGLHCWSTRGQKPRCWRCTMHCRSACACWPGETERSSRRRRAPRPVWNTS